MQLLSIPKTLTSIKIFPDLYEDDEKVFYHGTSEIYSNQIEQFGLFPNHKPLTPHFYSLYTFADKVFAFTSDNDNDFGAFNSAFRDAFQYFKDFTRISFSAVSFSAAYYSTGKMAGGQGLRHLVNLKNELSKLNFGLLDNAYINISESQKHYYETVNNEINNIKNSNGVVYAFKFESTDIIHLSYDKHSYHSVLLSVNHVHPSKIIAKMIIPSGLKLDPNLIEESHNKTLALSNTPDINKFIREIIFNNLDRTDINDYFNATV
jgi:hypothetical protein